MPLNNEIKEKISFEVIRTLVSRFNSFPEDASSNRNAPFHEAFLNAFADKLHDKVPDIPFFITLSSWLHGLNTTLGQSFFEKVAHILSAGEKREYTSKKLGNLQITRRQKDNIGDIITRLSNSTNLPNLDQENELIFIENNDDLINALDFSSDVFIEDEDKVTAIELKSVRPNSGEMRGEKQKILEGKAALFKEFPGKEIAFYIGFPFDPTSPESTTYDKPRFLGSIINMNKFFGQNETLIASELWNFLSADENTMEQIIEIINIVSTTEFLEKYKFITNKHNITTERYLSILEEWFLLSEKKLIENDEILQISIIDDNRLTRVYNQHCFNDKGQYNIERFNILDSFL